MPLATAIGMIALRKRAPYHQIKSGYAPVSMANPTMQDKLWRRIARTWSNRGTVNQSDCCASSRNSLNTPSKLLSCAKYHATKKHSLQNIKQQ